MNVRLTGPEMMVAAQGGVMRHIERIRAGAEEDPISWGLQIEWAASEIAVAKATGLFWEPTSREPGSVRIRSSQNHEDDLYVQAEEENDDVLFVWVTGRLPNFTIHGAIPASATRETNWQERNGYRIPKSALSPLSDFDLAPVGMG